jgi:MFS family permease
MNASRPWQGTVLAVLFYLLTAYAVFSAIAAGFGVSLLGAISGSMVEGVEGGEKAAGLVTGLLGGLGIFFALTILIGALISYLFGSGFWNGKHWPITLTSIFGGIALLLALSGMDLASILVTGVPVALAVSIWKHPFYNRIKHA